MYFCLLPFSAACLKSEAWSELFESSQVVCGYVSLSGRAENKRESYQDKRENVKKRGYQMREIYTYRFLRHVTGSKRKIYFCMGQIQNART